MLGNFKTINPRTIKDVLGYGAESNKITTARTGLSTTRKRGNTQSMFAGALAAVWMEEEYGIMLDADQYVKIAATSVDSFASNDELSVFIHTKEVV